MRSLEMYSLQGRMVWREELSGTEASLRLPGFVPGGQMYLLRAAGEQAVRVEKLIVE
ncbi:MAG: T9SS type A sorting domain-containing protein [Phaeodactylibacter sp.]|nr:T9SS type A sorting domain-containing protein [Phaeodactylibacter sp.]